MPYGEDKTCFTCFWMWKPDNTLRCTRLPPSPLVHDSMIDLAKSNVTKYMPCPLVPGCGEWKEIPIIEIEEIDENMRQ